MADYNRIFKESSRAKRSKTAINKSMIQVLYPEAYANTHVMPSKSIDRWIYRSDRAKLWWDHSEKKFLYILLALLTTIFLIYSVMRFNVFSTTLEHIESADSDLEAELQRRWNLYSNMVVVVVNYLNYEQDRVQSTWEARKDMVHGPSAAALAAQLAQSASAATGLRNGIPVTPGQINPDAGQNPAPNAALKATAPAVVPKTAVPGLVPPAQKKIQSEILNLQETLSKNPSGIMNKIFALQENYPDLKSVVPFEILLKQVIETEDRVTAQRINLNHTISNYNTNITVFPSNLIAYFTGFGFARRFYTEENVREIPNLGNYDWEKRMQNLKAEPSHVPRVLRKLGHQTEIESAPEPVHLKYDPSYYRQQR